MGKEGQFVFPMYRLEGLIQRAVDNSKRGVQAAVGTQIYLLASKLHELWKGLVTKQRIRNEMMTSIEGGRGYRRKKKWNGQALKVAMGTGSRTIVAAELARQGRNWQSFLRRNVGVLGIDRVNQIKQRSRYRFSTLKRGELQKIIFEAEVKRRERGIGYQATGWLPGVWRFSQRRGAGSRFARVREYGFQSWADASGSKRVVKNAPGRVLEKWEGVHRYRVALVNFAHGINQTDSRYGLVEKTIEARRADILDHLQSTLEASVAGAARGES